MLGISHAFVFRVPFRGTSFRVPMREPRESPQTRTGDPSMPNKTKKNGRPKSDPFMFWCKLMGHPKVLPGPIMSDPWARARDMTHGTRATIEVTHFRYFEFRNDGTP